MMREFLCFCELYSDSVMGKHRLIYVTVKAATTDLEDIYFCGGVIRIST